MTFERILIYAIIGLFLIFIILTSRVIPFFTKIPRYYAWQKFAKNSGLTFMNGNFFNGLHEPAPKVVGIYRKRAIIIGADTYGKFGFFDSFTQIVIPLENRQTSTLPRGGVFYARRANLRDKFFEKYHGLFSEAVSFHSYRVYGVPENMKNFINRDSAFQAIISDKKFSGLVIEEQNLYFRKRNVDVNSNNIKLLVDKLCDIAEAFEQYSTVWTK